MKETFEEIVKIMEHLRSEKGCAWDREQTIKTMKKDLLEEVNEICGAIDKEDYENLKEEIGDVMWGLIFISQIAKEEGRFDIKDVLTELKDKMIRRHPHVFGDKKADTSEQAKKVFYEAKDKEKLKNKT